MPSSNSSASARSGFRVDLYKEVFINVLMDDRIDSRVTDERMVTADQKCNYTGKTQDQFMTDAEFLATYKATLTRIEECVEAAIVDRDADIDYESANDMLTLTFSNGSVAIISRQSAIKQLWLAARSGGFHFDYDESRKQWVCTATLQTLPEMLAEVCTQQGGVQMDFSC